MATVSNNPLLNGLSGMLGQRIVFKNLRGKTIVAKAPSPPQRQSVHQKQNRSKFRDAAAWAQGILLDADQKAYYQNKARKLKLPNAYTAAITDYMRAPQLISHLHRDTTTCCLSKSDFQLKRAEVVIRRKEGEEVRVIAPRGGEWIFKLAKDESSERNYVRVTDGADRMVILPLPG